MRLQGGEVEPSALVAWLGTPSLVDPARLVVVHAAERLGCDGVGRVLEGLRRHPMGPADRLVFLDGSSAATLASWAEGLAGKPPPVQVVRLEDPAAAITWAYETHRPAMTEPAARWVRAALQRFPERADAELAKLATYPQGPVDLVTARYLLSADLVEQAGDEPATTADDRRRFQFVEVALVGRAGAALRLMDALLREGIPVAWLWREMCRQVMQLWWIAEVAEDRLGPPAAWPARLPDGLVPLRMPPAALQRCVQLARCWGTDGLLQILGWVADSDHRAHRGARPEELLRDLVLRLALGAAGSGGGGRRR